MFNRFSLLIFSFLILLLAGCGERNEASSYFYSPSFTNDGSIVFIYGLQSINKNFLGSELSSSYTETVKTMDTAGAGETFIYDTTGDVPYSMSCSPATGIKYVAYMGDLRNSSFGKIGIRNIKPSNQTGLTRAEMVFDDASRIRSFDWSADGNKLVFCNDTGVVTRNWNDYTGATDTVIIPQTGVEFVTWKYGNRIAFVYTDTTGRHLSVINSDGSGRVDLPAAAMLEKPQVSPIATNEVYGIAGGSYCKIDLNDAAPATAEILAKFRGELPRISPTGDVVVYSKTGAQSGIYSLNLTTKVESTLK
ncbi:MAG: hypothetical protein KKC80_04915 [Candidatus Margulisbacteria bacterium]|nr:hypothetical protein [Candidatus Margulisiibacteriota bacterium]MBU1617265.1 hypothetical protein [Candidatus Margulisiibacteriota bacterium]